MSANFAQVARDIRADDFDEFEMGRRVIQAHNTDAVNASVYAHDSAIAMASAIKTLPQAFAPDALVMLHAFWQWTRANSNQHLDVWQRLNGHIEDAMAVLSEEVEDQ